jgi:hypothetical protein
MIHALELENFKGVGARTRIELAPVTLLFGANNVGKSTILHSLLFVHEVLRSGSADVDRTELGHEALELGGFARIVHRHDKERSIHVRVEFDTGNSVNRLGRDLEGFSFPDLDDSITTAWVEFRAAHRQGSAVVEAITIGSGDEPLVWIELGRTLREGEPLLTQVNMGHPILGERGRELGPAWEEVSLDVTGRGFGDGTGFGMGKGALLDRGGFGDGRAVPMFAIRRTRRSALPPLDEPIRIVPSEPVPTRSLSGSRSGSRSVSGSGSLSGSRSASRSRSQSDVDESVGDEAALVDDEVQTFLELVVIGICGQLSDSLRDALYIGPLRAVPSRGFLLEGGGGGMSRWSDGLAAWEALLSGEPSLVEKTNEWLARLGVGCKVVVQELFDQKASAEDVATRHVDICARRLLLDSGSGTLVLPSELGAGVSQLVPVVVASVLPHHRGLVMVEQPEIHVHPALQVELGDLFIESAAERQFIVETHSEHLILRLLVTSGLGLPHSVFRLANHASQSGWTLHWSSPKEQLRSR